MSPWAWVALWVIVFLSCLETIVLMILLHEPDMLLLGLCLTAMAASVYWIIRNLEWR